MDSNLSKIKPKFRTKGNITGNFGMPKVKSGSILSEIGMTDARSLKITTKDDYLNRMVTAYETTEDPKLKKFCYEEVRKIMVQRGVW